ncbi:MAG: hypothetical protein PVH43_09090, partial [Desulfobacterales bacterium]
MRKPIYPILMTAILLMSYNATAAELKDGFFGIEWKANLSELSGFKKVGENLNVIYFANPERVFTIDDVKIPDVLYGSYANQFFAVY